MPQPIPPGFHKTLHIGMWMEHRGHDVLKSVDCRWLRCTVFFHWNPWSEGCMGSANLRQNGSRKINLICLGSILAAKKERG